MAKAKKATKKKKVAYIVRKVRGRVTGKLRLRKVYPNPNAGVIYPSGKIIKAFRLSLGLLQKEFAAELGIEPRTAHNLENGRARPGPETKLRLNQLARRHGRGDLFPSFSSEEIAKIRRTLGLDLQQFATKLGILPRSLYELEAGISFPTDPTIAKLATYAKKAGIKLTAPKKAYSQLIAEQNEAKAKKSTRPRRKKRK